MFLRAHRREKDGKDHTYWSLVETVRTPDGPRQRTLCYLGELNDSAQARWLKTIEVFNEQGEAQQLKLFPSNVEPPPDDPPGDARRPRPLPQRDGGRVPHPLRRLRALLGIPPEVTPVGVIPIGHRAPDVPSPSLKRGRTPDADYLHHETW